MIQRNFLESSHAQNLQKSVERAVEHEALLDDGRKHINRDRDPNLCLHRILRGSVKCLDPQVLFDPTKKQLYMPAALVKRRDDRSRKDKIIGQKGQIAVVVPVIESDAAELVGIGVVGIESREDDRLIADQIRGFIHRPRVEPAALKIGLSADDEKGLTLMEEVETGEIKVATIEDIETAGLGDEIIQDPDVVNFSFCDLDKRGDRAPQIQKGMELDGGLGLAENGPREKRKTKIDRCGVEGINGLFEFQSEIVVGIKVASLMDEDLGEVGVDAPIASLIGVGQSTSGDPAAESHVIELRRHSAETGLDIAEALAVGQLSESHGEKLVPAGKAFDFMAAVITDDAATELMDGQEIDKLDENGFTDIHRPLLAVVGQRNDLIVI